MRSFRSFRSFLGEVLPEVFPVCSGSHEKKVNLGEVFPCSGSHEKKVNLGEVFPMRSDMVL